MSADWQVGDLALCVAAPDDPRFGPAPYEEGATYSVTGVAVNYRGSVGLRLAGVEIHSDSGAAWHGNFRKIRPDEHEPCEPEFVTLLTRVKRKEWA